MKIVSVLSAVGFLIGACVSAYQWNAPAARYCVVMAMLWCIYLKLLCMEDK